MPRTREHATLRKDGRWQCKYHGRCFTARTEAEALAMRAEYKARELLQLQEASRPKSVRGWSAEWLHLYKSGVSDRCYNAYSAHLDRLNEACGDKLLSEVTPADAMAVWQKYQGYSASTVKLAQQLFRGLFDAAIDNDYCVKNPFRAKTVTPPKAAAGTHRALTEEEISLIASTPHRIQRAVMVMLYAGLRRGEVLALTADDIDLAAGVIHVSKAVRYDANAPILSSPKTAAGTRTVPILPPLRPILEDAAGVIAPSAAGGIMTEQAWQRAWESYLHTLSAAAGHPVEIRAHDLRHTYCTLLCDAGVPIKLAMEWLGHADQQMILRVYDHNTPARRAAALAAVTKHLQSNTGGISGGS